MSKNLKTLICSILCLLFVAGTVVAVFADGGNAPAPGIESATDDEPAAPVYRLGDVNGDGEITAGDARLALRYSAKLEPDFTPEQIIAADVIVDGKVLASDARLILRVSARLQPESDLGLPAAEDTSE